MRIDNIHKEKRSINEDIKKVNLLLDRIIYEIKHAPPSRTVRERCAQVIWLNETAAILTQNATFQSKRIIEDLIYEDNEEV